MFRSLTSSRAPKVIVAERFIASRANLAAVLLPADVIATVTTSRLRVIIVESARGPESHRILTVTNPSLARSESLLLKFAPFDSRAGDAFTVIALDDSTRHDPPANEELRAIVDSVNTRAPIGIACPDPLSSETYFADERAITAIRTGDTTGRIRTAWFIDAFWCDAYGIYIRGWAHAYEHRLQRLVFESAGRSATVTRFEDRPDLLTHYPEHEHVRHAGFAIHIPSPPGHRVTVRFVTDGGDVTLPFPLPEGQVPPIVEDDSDDEVSPMLRRFADLVNARGGRLLQIGARTPPGCDTVPPRHLLRNVRHIGLDIHPGHNVNLVGDAHALGEFIRPASIDAVCSASVIEHLSMPWLVAAETNRVLKTGGLVYHQVPGAWPPHAQPNDYWRMSAEGLKVLFGEAAGFEVLETSESGRATIIPSPNWRKQFLDMPTHPTFALVEILARKTHDLPPGSVAWPRMSGAGEKASQRYPIDGLRPRRGDES